MKEDRRDDKRVATNLLAKWDGLSGAAEARIEDISLGGCFVNTKGQVQIEEVVNLQMRQQSGEWLRLQCKVVSFQPGIGFGVVFGPMTEEQRRTLKQLIN